MTKPKPAGGEKRSMYKYATQPVSKCCQAPIEAVGGDEGTMHWECTKCKKPCDIWTPLGTKLATMIPPIKKEEKGWEKRFEKDFREETVNGIQGILVHNVYDPSPNESSLTGCGITNRWFVENYIEKFIIPTVLSQAKREWVGEWVERIEQIPQLSIKADNKIFKGLLNRHDVLDVISKLKDAL